MRINLGLKLGYTWQKLTSFLWIAAQIFLDFYNHSESFGIYGLN